MCALSVSFREWEPISPLLHLIPEKGQRLSSLSAFDIVVTSISLCGRYLAVATNMAILYVIDRKNRVICQRYKILNKNEDLTKTLISHQDGEEYFIASGSACGHVTVIQTHLETSATDVKTSTYQAIPTSDAKITCLQFTPDHRKLFTGDEGGTVTVWTVDHDAAALVSLVVVKESHPIVQLCLRHSSLLISTTMDSYLYNVTTQTISKIGTKPRKVESFYGACFIPLTDTDSQIMCSRAGLRLWRCSEFGHVLITHMFKDSLANVPFMKLHGEPQIDVDKPLQFGILELINSNLLLSWCGSCFLLIDISDPTNCSLQAAFKDLSKVTDISVWNEEIIVLTDGLKRRLYHLSAHQEPKYSINSSKVKADISPPITEEAQEKNSSDEKLPPVVEAFDLKEIELSSTEGEPVQAGASEKLAANLNEFQSKLQSGFSAVKEKFAASSEDMKNVGIHLKLGFGKLFKKPQTKEEHAQVEEKQTCQHSQPSPAQSSTVPTMPPESSLLIQAANNSQKLTSSVELSSHVNIYPENYIKPAEVFKHYIPSGETPGLVERLHPENLGTHKVGSRSNKAVVPEKPSSGLEPIAEQVLSNGNNRRQSVSEDGALFQLVKESVSHIQEESNKEDDDRLSSGDHCPKIQHQVDEKKPASQKQYNDWPEANVPTHHTRTDLTLSHELASSCEYSPKDRRRTETSSSATSSQSIASKKSSKSTATEPSAEDLLAKLRDLDTKRFDIDSFTSEYFRDEKAEAEISHLDYEHAESLGRSVSIQEELSDSGSSHEDSPEDEEDIYRRRRHTSSLTDNHMSPPSYEASDNLGQEASNGLQAMAVHSFSHVLILERWTCDDMISAPVSMSMSDTYIWITDRRQHVYTARLSDRCLIWRNLDSKATQISAAPTGYLAWKTYKDNAYAGHCRTPPYNPSHMKWTQAVKDVQSVSVDDTSAWYIKKNREVWCQRHLSRTRPILSGVKVPCEHSISKITSRSGITWALSSDGRMFSIQVNPVTDRADWLLVSAANNIVDICLVKDGTACWMLDSDDTLWYTDGITVSSTTGSGKMWQVSYFEGISINNRAKFKNLLMLRPALGMQGLVAANNNVLCVVTSVLPHSVYVCRGHTIGYRWNATHLQALTSTAKWKSACWSNDVLLCLYETGELMSVNLHNGSTINIEPPRVSGGSVKVEVLTACSQSIWLILSGANSAHYIYYSHVQSHSIDCLRLGMQWKELDCLQFENHHLKAISIGNTMAWAVDSKGLVYMSFGVNAKREECMSPAWVPVDSPKSTPFRSVCVNESGSCVWAIDELHNIFVRKGVSEEYPIGESWMCVAGVQAKEISISDDLVWVLTPQGAILCRCNVTPELPAGEYWKKIPGNLRHIASSSDNKLVGLSATGQLLQCEIKVIGAVNESNTSDFVTEDGDWTLI